jgi:hypothetical protein
MEGPILINDAYGAVLARPTRILAGITDPILWGAFSLSIDPQIPLAPNGKPPYTGRTWKTRYSFCK